MTTDFRCLVAPQTIATLRWADAHVTTVHYIRDTYIRCVIATRTSHTRDFTVYSCYVVVLYVPVYMHVKLMIKYIRVFGAGVPLTHYRVYIALRTAPNHVNEIYYPMERFKI